MWRPCDGWAWRSPGFWGVEGESQRAAKTLGLPKAYRDFEEVLADPSVQAVHLAAPNRLHYDGQGRAEGRQARAVREAAGDELARVGRAGRAGPAKRLAAGVNYNVRFYPLNLEAADMMRRGDLGQVYSINGSYVQDWLFYDTDYNWRVLAEQGGELRAIADIGTHWMDLVHVDHRPGGRGRLADL